MRRRRTIKRLRYITIILAAVLIGAVIAAAVTTSAEADEYLEQVDEFIATHENTSNTLDALEPETVNLSYADWQAQQSAETAAVFSPDEEMILALMVWGEIAHCDQTADYYGAYLQACVALNRLDQGWSDTLTGVIYQEGQFCPEYYETLLYYGDCPNEACWMAVRDAIAWNDTPEGLVFADCRDTVPEGCWIYYVSPTGQRFYCTY